MKNILPLVVFFILTNSAYTQNLKLSEGESFVDINGIKHWVKVKGTINNTTPLIILHGGPGGDNSVFERTAGPLLEKATTIVYYEQRGCGRSYAAKDTNDYKISVLIDDLNYLIEALGVEKVSLLGYSFGAELALRFTKQYPKKVNKLILSAPVELATATKLIQIQGFFSIANSELRKTISNIIEKKSTIEEKYFEVWNSVSSSVVDSFLFVNQNNAKVNRRLWQESKLPSRGRRHFQRVIFETIQGDLLETVVELETPCLIITGIHDKNGGFHLGKDLHQILPNSELKLYKSSAHFPDFEETDKFGSDVIEFILND